MTERRLIDVAANLRATQVQMESDMASRQAMADQLGVALLRAGEANRAKSAFLASMSHELRTPLNAIIGFSDLMLRANAPAPPSQHKYLERINRSGRHLLAIINDILDLSRIEAGKVVVDLADADLVPVIREVIDMHGTQVHPGVALEADMPSGPLIVTTDAFRLRQVLVNLVSNALKFTDRGGVTVHAARLEAWPAPPTQVACPALRLRVEDTGIGIKAEDLATLFQPFRQLDTGLARQHEGTGLGLAICRRLATLLGGEITATSEWGKGSRFVLTLPLERPSA